MSERDDLKVYFSKVRKILNDIMILEKIAANPLEYLKNLQAKIGYDIYQMQMMWWFIDEYGMEDEAKKFEIMLKEKNLVNAKKKLDNLLNENIIFPKYRNFVAINQMAEYLDSGRCSTLEGPDGAYNLFESESRQNYIISRLDVIVDQLEEIKQNQYYIYTAIKESTDVLKNTIQNAVPIIKVYVN